MKKLTRSIGTVTLISFSLVFLQACAPSAHDQFADAYQTPIVTTKPYTLTIFRNDNF